MSRSVRLIAVHDEYDSDLGLAVKGTPTQYEGFMADREGGLIAHDLVEHQNGVRNIGTVDDELEAMGGIWHTRGRWGLSYNLLTMHEHVAYDISRMFYEGEFWSMPKLGTRLHDELEDDFDEIERIAAKSAKSELGEYFDYDKRQELPLFLEAARRRFRIGYRKATARFGQDFASNNFYENIKRAAGKATKWIEYEGQEFILTFDRCEAKVREIEYVYD